VSERDLGLLASCIFSSGCIAGSDASGKFVNAMLAVAWLLYAMTA
jgi:hypothetical protein